MHSGGGLKHDFGHIYIEADESEAVKVFYSRFGTNPRRVSCTCCGEDYSIDTTETLEQATAFHRGCEWVDGGYVESDKCQPLEKYSQNKDVCVIRKSDIRPEDLDTDVPEQGYVWVD